VVDVEIFSLINSAEREGGACHISLTAGAGGQAAGKGSLAAAQVGTQLDNFASFKARADQ
jgi:hypothetical protein